MEEFNSYPVFKGLQKPLEFMGIRGKFIYYAAGTFLLGFIGFLVFNIIINFFAGAIALQLLLVLELSSSLSSKNLDYTQRNVIKELYITQGYLIISYGKEKRETI